MNTSPSSERSQKIAALNDQFRTTLTGGIVLVTSGVQMLGRSGVTEALAAVQAFDSFTEDNDPHGEHDFGSFTVEGFRLFWKIDYYDLFLEAGASDPCDQHRTRRVLTVMLADEY